MRAHGEERSVEGAGKVTKKTLDERAEEVRDAVCTADVRGWPAGRCPLPEVVAAYEAEREARLALEARVRELLDAHAKLLDRLETAKARVRELEAERDRARAYAKGFV